MEGRHAGGALAPDARGARRKEETPVTWSARVVWLPPEDAEAGLLRSALLAFEN
jgi:hypothetical protein